MLEIKRLAGLVFLLTFGVSFCIAANEGTEPNAAELVRAVRESESWIHEVDSMYLRIESKWTRTAEGIATTQAECEEQCLEQNENPDAGTNQPLDMKLNSEGILEYAFDEGRVRFFNKEFDRGQRLTVWDGRKFIAHEKYFSNGREQYYLHWTPQGNFEELIAYQSSWLKSQPHSFWWDRKDVDELSGYYGRAEDFELAGRCDYRGIDCYVLEFRPKELWGLMVGQAHRCDYGIMDPDQYGLIGEVKGLVDQLYRWYIGTKDHRLYGFVWLIRNKPHTEHWMLDYQEVATGCWLPMSQGYELYDQSDDGEHFLLARRDLKVLDVRINEKLPDELFRIEMQKGVQVVDNLSGRNLTYTYKPEPPSLLGKALPDFNDIEIEFTREHAQDKMILVCFFDIEQRPSRNCLRELNAKAQAGPERSRRELKAKDVIIVAVHTSNIERTKLDEWIKENNISFPVGIIKADPSTTLRTGVEQTHFNWGVKSLPWLILTDKNHVVVSDGFNLGEIDDKLKKLSP